MIARVLLALLLLAAPASAWEIKTSGPVTITGAGALPTLMTAPPVVDPPPLPPPPSVPPVVDNASFVFPVQQPEQETDQACRYFNLGPEVGGVYATLPSCRNPLRGSHLFACITPMGMLYQRQSIGGFRLYVPRSLTPGLIRLLCAGGAI